MESAPEPETAAQEQRRSKRFRTSLVVELKHGSKSQRVRTLDVSRHGLFVETNEPPPERFLVTLTVHLPDGPLAATAFVSRKVVGDKDRVPGAGLQLFALAASAKTRWDQFVNSLSGLAHRLEQRAAEERAKQRAPNVATFLIKLRDVPRLAEFYEKNVRAGGLFMATPLIKETGADIALVIIHPSSENEFMLLGRVDRVCRERPKGMEIKLEELSDKERAAFKSFVRSGSNPLAKKKAIPKPADSATIDVNILPPEKDTGDISIDIIVDEEALEESRRFEWSEITNQELIVDDFALVEDESDQPRALTLEGLIASSRDRAITVRISCRKCEALGRPMVFGGLGGLLGVFASRRPYWCGKCDGFVSVPRLKSATERKRIQEGLDARGAETLRMPVELSYAFELASIASTHPRCPGCGSAVRATKAVKHLKDALARLDREDGDRDQIVPLKDVKCGECGAKGILLERLDELEAHVRIEEPDDPTNIRIEAPEETSAVAPASTTNLAEP